jgi:hypothetical protein
MDEPLPQAQRELLDAFRKRIQTLDETDKAILAYVGAWCDRNTEGRVAWEVGRHYGDGLGRHKLWFDLTREITELCSVGNWPGTPTSQLHHVLTDTCFGYVLQDRYPQHTGPLLEAWEQATAVFNLNLTDMEKETLTALMKDSELPISELATTAQDISNSEKREVKLAKKTKMKSSPLER